MERDETNVRIINRDRTFLTRLGSMIVGPAGIARMLAVAAAIMHILSLNERKKAEETLAGVFFWAGAAAERGLRLLL